MNNKQEYILCAAVKRKTPRKCEPYWKGTNDICNIEIGYRHHDILQRFGKDILSTKPEDQGFYTSKGRFVNRAEAMMIAYNAGQVDKEIAFSKSYEELEIKFENSNTGNYQKYNILFSENLY